MARRPPAAMLSSTRQLPARFPHRDGMQLRKQIGVAVAQVERAGNALGWGQGGILRARVGAYGIGNRAHEASIEGDRVIRLLRRD